MEARAVPEQSLEQRLAALERANEVRIYRAQLKREIKTKSKQAGVAEVAWQIADPHPLVESMKIQELLLACPKIGKAKAGRILLVCKVSPSRTVGGLSGRQRLELVCQLGTLPEDDGLIRKLKAVSA